MNFRVILEELRNMSIDNFSLWGGGGGGKLQQLNNRYLEWANNELEEKINKNSKDHILKKRISMNHKRNRK